MVLAVVQRDHVLLWALFCIHFPLQWGTLYKFSSEVKSATNTSNTLEIEQLKEEHIPGENIARIANAVQCHN